MNQIVSVSFGKDSLAMLLLLLEAGRPIDEVVFYNTGMEFDAIYKVRDKVVKEFLEPRGIKYTELKPNKPFKYYMLEKPVKDHFGYQWCGGRCRWGTSMKLQAIEKYCKGSIQYVGIAYDEQNRIKTNLKIYPLVIYKMTEKDCLEYCRKKGFVWKEGDKDLYDILDRVSCWCCANKNLKELRNYKKHLPKYWEKLKQLQKKIDRPFHNGKTIFELEERFEKEQKQGELL